MQPRSSRVFPSSSACEPVSGSASGGATIRKSRVIFTGERIQFSVLLTMMATGVGNFDGLDYQGFSLCSKQLANSLCSGHVIETAKFDFQFTRDLNPESGFFEKTGPPTSYRVVDCACGPAVAHHRQQLAANPLQCQTDAPLTLATRLLDHAPALLLVEPSQPIDQRRIRHGRWAAYLHHPSLPSYLNLLRQNQAAPLVRTLFLGLLSGLLVYQPREHLCSHHREHLFPTEGTPARVSHK